MTGKEGLEARLRGALEASQAAGRAILEVYATDFTVDLKGDQSPLTLADRRAHAVICESLAPFGLPVLSEEGRSIPFAERQGWDFFWMVDPLDGTKEFIQKNGEFTVNIALIRQGRPWLGVVYAPALGELYFAAEGLGAYRSGEPAAADPASGASRLQLAPLPSEGKALRVVASRSHASPETESYLGQLGEKYPVELLCSGSSLKFCHVAEGRAHLYPRFAPTMEWDTAAGQAVVEQAGGTVWDWKTKGPLPYNKENLLNPWFVAGQGLPGR